ncbi:MAG: hypothetical protein WBK77_05650 [Alphaproteobacteria bacterium]
MSCNGADTCLAKEIIKAFHVAYEDAIMGYFSAEFQTYRDWLVDTFFKQQVLPALMKFTEQMSAVGMYQVFIFGTFLDAKHQLETQRLFQQLQFEAQRDYQPSDDFCWFGTNVRSLGASEELGKYNAIALGEMQMKRQLGSDNSGGAEESDMDKGNRWQHFTANHCDPDDGNRIEGTAGTGLQLACGGGGGGGGARSNNDVDYTRMIEEPRTINVAFDDGTLTDPEQDILSISSNLYGHDILTRKMDNEYLKNQEYQHLYLALRSVAAKRNVAQNSFNAIVGMKSSGTDGMAGASKTHDFLAAVMQELGVPAADITPMIGEQPSYYAQLEILAKKIYQNPDFYASLYDSPANVARKGVAIKAIELMLDRAIYESQLRQEMATSVLLSSRLRTQFKKVNKDMTGAGGQ